MEEERDNRGKMGVQGRRGAWRGEEEWGEMGKKIEHGEGKRKKRKERR